MNFNSHLWSRASKNPQTVRIQHPVHSLAHDSDIERVQRMVWTAPRAETIREAEKVGFVDGVQYRTVDRWTILSSNAVTPSGRCSPSAFGIAGPPNRLGSVRSAFGLADRSWRFFLPALSVLLPRHSSPRNGCGIALEAEVSLPEYDPIPLPACVRHLFCWTNSLWEGRLAPPSPPTAARRRQRSASVATISLSDKYLRASLSAPFGFSARTLGPSPWGQRRDLPAPVKQLPYVRQGLANAGAESFWR